jgi:hypothetical protein
MENLPDDNYHTKALWPQMIVGYRKGDKYPNVSQKILKYVGQEVHWAEFGIRDGKVSSILISDLP